MSRTVCPAVSVVLMSAASAVGEGEVVLPYRPVERFLPAAVDGGPVVAERAGETLAEVQRREVRRLPQQPPYSGVQAHRIAPCDSTGVAVVLRVAARLRVGVDDAQGCLALRVPARACAAPGTGRRGSTRTWRGPAGQFLPRRPGSGPPRPLTDEDVEEGQGVGALRSGHDEYHPLTRGCSLAGATRLTSIDWGA